MNQVREEREDEPGIPEAYHIGAITQAIHALGSPFISEQRVMEEAEALGILYSERELEMSDEIEPRYVSVDDLYELGSVLGTDFSGEDLEREVKDLF